MSYMLILMSAVFTVFGFVLMSVVYLLLFGLFDCSRWIWLYSILCSGCDGSYALILICDECSFMCSYASADWLVVKNDGRPYVTEGRYRDSYVYILALTVCCQGNFPLIWVMPM